MIYLRQIQLNNFLSHEKSSVTFDGRDKFLIDGNSGAGKTSVFEAIVWALYGQSRTDNRLIVRKGAKKATVTLHLEDRNESTEESTIWVIERSSTPTGKHQLNIFKEVDGELTPHELSGVKEQQEWIETKLIGASYLLFVNSIAYVQGGEDLFVSQNAAKRKELLLEIVRTDDYENYHNKAKRKIADLTITRGNLETSVGEIDRIINTLSTQLVDKKSLQKSIKEVTKEIEVIEKEIENINKTVASVGDKSTKLNNLILNKTVLEHEINGLLREAERIEELKQKIKKIVDKNPEKEIQATQAEVSVNEKRIEELRKKIENYDTTTIERIVDDINKYGLQVAKTQGRVEDITRQITALSLSNTCPSGDKCPYMSGVRRQLSHLAGELTTCITTQTNAETMLASLTQEEKEARSKIMNKDEYLAINKNLADLGNEKIRYEYRILELQQMLIEKKTMEDVVAAPMTSPIDKAQKEWTLADAVRQIAELKEEMDGTDVNGLNQKIKELQGLKTSKMVLIQQNKSKIEASEANEKMIVENKERQKSIVSSELPEVIKKIEKVELVKDAFGPNGIRSVVIDYIIPKLEDNINEILAQLSEFQIRLDTQSDTVSGGIKEGLFITIINELGEELPFEAFSGGEKLKITVAISEALAGLQKVGFRLFDELFLALDEDSTENFAFIMERLQSRFSQVGCISHLRSIKDLFDKKITCVKNNGVTKIIE